MKRTAAILAGLTLVGGAAAAQETTTQDPYGEAQTETGDPVQTMPEEEQTGHGVSDMSPDELSGRTVMTMDGEEIGQIEEVGYSSTYREQVATVNVGGFLGVGQKTIAIPLSRLEMGSDDGLQTTMDRQEIEAAQEFDPSNLSTEQQPQQDW